MTGEALSDEELFPLFEAARWAPSSFNSQLWRFIIARRQHPVEFEKFVGLAHAGEPVVGQGCGCPSSLLRQGTRFEFNDKPAITHAFDAGAAWENLAIEATLRGLVAHGMQGFDYDRAKAELLIPDEFEVHAMIAIGRRGKRREFYPKNCGPWNTRMRRRPLREIVFEGSSLKQFRSCHCETSEHGYHSRGRRCRSTSGRTPAQRCTCGRRSSAR